MPHTKRKPWHCRWFRNQERAEIPPGSAPKLSFSEPTPKNAPKIDTWHGISQPIFGVGKWSAPQKMQNHMPNKCYVMVLGRFWPFKVRKFQKTVKIWRFCHAWQKRLKTHISAPRYRTEMIHHSKCSKFCVWKKLFYKLFREMATKKFQFLTPGNRA